jgi:hypothetical protein
MGARIPEKNKKDGVCYVCSDEGVELPVIDVTHPAFALDPTVGEISRRVEAYLRGEDRWERMPRILRWGISRFCLRRSVLARGGTGLDGSLMSGMTTYLMKLGPDNLGEGYAKSLDRKVAEALPPYGVRLRLRDMARLIAESLIPALAARPGQPIRLLNIAGGPAMDSLNGLILVRRERPGLLEGRRIRVLVLDPDEAGPRFGARAAEALRGPGGALEGLDVAVERIDYDWADPVGLRRIGEGRNAEGALVAGSSEGGLFEYGSDEEILANLEVLREILPEDVRMVGSVLRDDRVTRAMRRSSRLSLRYLGAEVLGRLAERVGWSVERILEGPTLQSMVLKKAPGDATA